MSTLTDRIAEVLRDHDLKPEVWYEFSCECGVNGWDSYQEWQRHAAERVVAAIPELNETQLAELSRLHMAYEKIGDPYNLSTIAVEAADELSAAVGKLLVTRGYEGRI